MVAMNLLARSAFSHLSRREARGGWVAGTLVVFAEDPLHENAKLCANVVPNRPVDCDICPHSCDEFAGDGAQGVVAQYLDRAIGSDAA